MSYEDYWHKLKIYLDRILIKKTDREKSRITREYEI